MAVASITAAGLGGMAEPLARQAGGQAAGGGWAATLERALGGINDQQNQASQAVRDLAAGKADSLHGVMLSVARADLSFRLMLEVRNRLADSYQEVMRMQV